MQTQQNKPEGISPPALSVLQLDMRVNVTDKQLLTNLGYVKSLDLPKLRMAEPNDRTLAICGSGPSLEWNYKSIPQDCDVMALNGAFRFLRSKDEHPKYFAMLDSRPENANFLRGYYGMKTTALLASQVHANVIEEAVDRFDKVGVFHLGTPTTRFAFPDEDLYLGGGGTIGLTAISIAVALGYRSVILYGFDSSYWEDSKHVLPQPQNDKDEPIDIWVGTRRYRTSHALAAQCMDFFPFHKELMRLFPDFQLQVVGAGLFYDYVVTNNNPSTRERELAKYHQAYESEDYGMTQERYDGLLNLLNEFPRHYRYLDVSCGRGESLKIALDLGFQVVSGTETVDKLINANPRIGYGVLPKLSVPDKYYDVVSLIEVIEHLVPDDVAPALRELTRVARKHILISAAVADCWFGGVNLHPSAKPLEEWERLFKEEWGDRFYRVGSLGQSPVWRVDL